MTLPARPWHIDPDDRPDMEWNNHVLSADGHTVCFMAHNPDGNEAHENAARLIAAAPDLLEALQYVLSAHGEQLTDAFDQAHKAIAKATGAA